MIVRVVLVGKGEDAVELANKRRFGVVPVHAFDDGWLKGSGRDRRR